MKFKKNQVLVFKDREEVILKVSNSRISGVIVSDKNEYSVDFLMRWLQFGFVRVRG